MAEWPPGARGPPAPPPGVPERRDSLVARRKVLKSVARSVADSFTSLMNWGGDDYVMGHILSAARQSGRTTLEMDLFSAQASPEELLTPPVRRAVETYSARFRSLVTASGSDPSFVASARLKLEFDISVAAPAHRGSHLHQSPYVCTTTIEDDHGKLYESVLTGWWFPEVEPR
jgi:hypothetical protein